METTPLEDAIKTNKPILPLLEAGANVNAGPDLFTLAYWKGNVENLELLLQYGVKVGCVQARADQRLTSLALHAGAEVYTLNTIPVQSIKPLSLLQPIMVLREEDDWAQEHTDLRHTLRKRVREMMMKESSVNLFYRIKKQNALTHEMKLYLMYDDPLMSKMLQ